MTVRPHRPLSNNISLIIKKHLTLALVSECGLKVPYSDDWILDTYDFIYINGCLFANVSDISDISYISEY